MVWLWIFALAFVASAILRAVKWSVWAYRNELVYLSDEGFIRLVGRGLLNTFFDALALTGFAFFVTKTMLGG